MSVNQVPAEFMNNQVVVEDMVTDETYLINSTTLYEGENGVYKNLHVYFP